MYPLGFLPFFYSLVPDSVAVGAAAAVPLLALALWLYGVLPRSPSSSSLTPGDDDDDAPVHLPGSSLSHILPFFRHRFDFLNEGFQLAGQAIYQFSLLRTPVIVLSGEAARRDFFQAKDLDLNAGFKFLSGAIPMVPGVTSNLESRRIALIHKRLISSQTTERLSNLIPQILEDSRRVMSTWGYSGSLDPFQHLSELLFQTTVRCLAFTELADDPSTVRRLKGFYDTLDTATTPTTVLLPWIPSPSAVRRLIATKRIYDIVSGTLDERVQKGIVRDDTPQMLIDAGDERLVIVGFIMGLLVAGARSTGTTASWLITFLSGHSHWKEKAAEEVRRLVTEHATHLHSTASTSTLAEQDPAFAPTSGPPEAEAAFSPHARQTPPSCTDTDADSHRRERTESSSSTATATAPPSPLSSLAASLASVPLDAWENHTPTLDALIRETLRVAEPHVAMRQYLPPLHHHPDEKAAHAHTLYLGGKAVPPGAFVMYPFSDVHLSAEIYKDPWRWDPARAEMNLKAPYAYVGMGAGSTVCLGKRLATLELKLITALFVLGFSELRAVDGKGAPLAELPRPNWNDILTCKPPPGSCYVRFARTVDADPESDGRASSS